MKTKVSIVKIENGDIGTAVRQAVELAGGIEENHENSKPILIKPNALTSKKTWEAQLAVTTHPEVIRALIRILKEKGHEIVVGDSSGGGTNTQVVMHKAGFKKLEEEENVPVVSLTSEAEKVYIENHEKLSDVALAGLALTSDIINVPKMKTHALTRVTLAIKNLFGCVVGMEKKRVHGVSNTAKSFSQCLVDIYSVLKDNIMMNVLDATIAMEGFGPSDGTPKEMNLIMASKDAVALDSIATMVMGEKSLSVHTTKNAMQRGLGVAKLEEIEIVGEKIEDVKSKFSIPLRVISWLPIGKFWVLRAKQPKYVGEGCKACLKCQQVCPASAIVVDKENKEPVFDYTKCISCLCCYELCPEHAIYMGHMKYGKVIAGIITLVTISIITGVLLAIFL